MNATLYPDYLLRDIKRRMYSQQEMEEYCILTAKDFKFIDNPTSIAFLSALAKKESSYGQDVKPRCEPAYYYGGLLYRSSQSLMAYVSEWGCVASSSHGPWQIMAITAVERGFPDYENPMILQFAEISGPYVAMQLNWLIARGATDALSLAAAWNGGQGAIKPDRRNEQVQKYVKDFELIYRKERSKYTGAV